MTPQEAAAVRDLLARVQRAEARADKLQRAIDFQRDRPSRDVVRLQRSNARLRRKLQEAQDAGRYWHGRALAAEGFGRD